VVGLTLTKCLRRSLILAMGGFCKSLEEVINMERKIQKTLIKMVASKSTKPFVFILKLIVGNKGVG
jgi:hypothetical protein